MAPAYFLVFFLLSHLLLPLSALANPTNCLPYYCRDPKEIDEYHYSEFGWLTVDNCTEPVQKIQLEMMGGQWNDVVSISSADTIDLNEHGYSDWCKCESPEKFNSSTSPSITFRTTFKLPRLKCNHSTRTVKYFGYGSSHVCERFPLENPTSQCLNSHPPINIIHVGNRNFSLSAADIFFHVHVYESCDICYYKGGKCYHDNNGGFHCMNEDKGNLRLKLALGLGIGIPAVLIIFLLILFFGRRHYKQKHASSDFLMRNISADPTSKSELDRGGVYFGVPIFSYSELEEATNNFDPSKELGDGGFGTVYHGKLQDGREVAVKRLYENSYKRVEQFMNEVEILTRLRHKNLVSLYGCTSRHSRELLLVYEFIPNGTVADHLHGDRAKPGSLTWPIRMSIAIETAEALAYLHATDIIHRDVKTNNILLDNNFCVKVADFGLSRLFPIDCTHISTAPQGTPGYLDPEYHQCYQLTDKSDVYSFGVVLIELISSLPAVDISRHRHEINLANLAINKIQNSALHELVDPCLGFESNLVVRRMMTSVAELAFRCLQQDKEMRPYMDEVLEVLKGIESEECEAEKVKETDDDVGVMKCTRAPVSLDSNADGLLMKMQLPHSLNYVTKKPVHGSTRPNASI